MVDQTKDVENKIVTYRVALDDIIKQLASKRTELSTLAKKTMADFEASIPALNEKISVLRVEAAKLEVLVKERQEAYQSQRSSCTVEFDELKEKLTKEHNKKLAECVEAQKAIDKVREDYRARAVSLEAKHNEFDSMIMAANAAQRAHQATVTDFGNERQRARAEMSAVKEELAAALTQSGELNERLNSDLAIIATQKESWNEKQEQANAILARIDEATGILNKASDKEKENKKREQELNTMQAQILVDRKKNVNRSEELNLTEQVLKTREDNVRLLESSILGESK